MVFIFKEYKVLNLIRNTFRVWLSFFGLGFWVVSSLEFGFVEERGFEMGVFRFRL